MKTEPSLLDRVLEEAGRRSMEVVPHKPRPVERWNAKVIPLPTRQWPLDRQRVVLEKQLELTQKALRGAQ
jgi:hypothetical protein